MRRAVLVICDGLRADMLDPVSTPHLAALAGRALSFARHRGVFPSVTRVTSASIATGSHPGRHGLQGNVMAIDEGGGLVALSVGDVDFRARLRRATGRTLHVPTLAERLAGHGGAIVMSNVSPGAAHFQDPDGHGWVYHRSGSARPGGAAVAADDELRVSHDAAGDTAMTERFCNDVLGARRPTLAVLWLCEPDHTGHGSPLGSPEYMTALAAADRCVGRVAATVAALPDAAETLLLVGSDHGHETVARAIRVDERLVAAGLKAAIDSRDVVVADNGSAALIHLADAARPRLDAILAFLEREDWVGEIHAGAALRAIGQNDATSLAVAVSLRKSAAANGYGIRGTTDRVLASGSTKERIGWGDHGGLGEYEQRPFLMAHGAGIPAGAVRHGATSVTDIAPTILAHLGLPAAGMDGRTLDLG
ncbi:MAG: alkaline phosphatase family protein [Alphaproteobacteria bacterium]